jgi:dihydroxy-acid dehydratase
MSLIATVTVLGAIASLASGLRLSPSNGGAVRLSTSLSMNAAPEPVPVVLNKYSRTITEPPSQGASQAMLYATGVTPETIVLPQIGIGSMWFEGNPCNMHLLDLSAHVKEGVASAGMTPYRFNTIGVSDGISMGTDGMCFSLQSRDIIADSIETIMGAQWYDGLIAIPGCDKNMPGCVMAMARLNRPSIMVYGGTIRAGCTAKGEKLDIVSAFQAYGEKMYDRITEEERKEIVEVTHQHNQH